MTWDYLDAVPTAGRNISDYVSISPCPNVAPMMERRRRMSVRTAATRLKTTHPAGKPAVERHFTVRTTVNMNTVELANGGSVRTAGWRHMSQAVSSRRWGNMKLKIISAIKSVKPDGNNRTGSAATTHYGTEGWTGIGLSEARWRHGAGVQNEKTTWPTPARCAEIPTVPYTYITSSPFYQAGQMMNTTTSPFALLATGRWNHSPNGWMSSAPYCPSSREGWRQGG